MQIFGVVAASLVIFAEYSFLLLEDMPQTKFHPIVIFLYVAFFWFFWMYARLTKPVRPLVVVPAPFAWGFLFFLAMIVAATYAIQEAKSSDALSFARFMPLHAFLIMGYSIIFAMLLFGDLFLGPLCTILKLGRSFERDR